MAMGPEGSRPLHNFSLPRLKWGNQRFLRCMKVNNFPRANDAISDDHLQQSEAGTHKTKFTASNIASEGIEAVREKLMCDLKTAADKMKNAILKEEEAAVVEKKKKKKNDVLEGEESSEVRPWNLRTRRAACNAPVVGRHDNRRSHYSPEKCDGGNLAVARSEKKERLEFSVSLSKKEIEEDFMEILGHKPPRRPKKRPRTVQKQLDFLFPGLWLTEVAGERYKVPEGPDNGKR